MDDFEESFDNAQDKFYNKALRFLSYRPRSEKEVRDKLIWFAKKSNKKAATTEAQKENETQNFSPSADGSENFSVSVVARETSIIDKVIQKLKEQKFINDEEFAKWWIESRTRFKPRSLRLIKIELKQKGIEQDLVDSLIDDLRLMNNDLEQAKKLVEKRIERVRNLPKQEIYQKLGSYLARRGFDWDTIKQSIDELLFKEYTTNN